MVNLANPQKFSPLWEECQYFHQVLTLQISPTSIHPAISILSTEATKSSPTAASVRSIFNDRPSTSHISCLWSGPWPPHYPPGKGPTQVTDLKFRWARHIRCEFCVFLSSVFFQRPWPPPPLCPTGVLWRVLIHCLSSQNEWIKEICFWKLHKLVKYKDS